MDKTLRLILFATVGLAVFADFVPATEFFGIELNFSTLHIFLFNLTSGGLLITTFARGRTSPGTFGIVYYALAVAFTLGAFVNFMAVNVITALLLAAMLESVRWKKFSWFPWEFFTRAPASRKFEQASMLCLSSGLIICASTIVAKEFLQIPWVPAKLDLHVFYLGFSFPLSLIFFSFIFRRLEACERPPSRLESEVAFWFLNLGVIFFFLFIMAEIYGMQMVMAFTLFTVVVITYRLHLTRCASEEGGAYVTSGLGFLVLGSLTGIAYILVLWLGSDYGMVTRYLLSLHAAATVFGWNMNWVLLAAPAGGRGPGTSPALLIPLHWAFVILMPAGRLSPVLAFVAMILCLLFLDRALFSRDDEAVVQ